MYLVVAEKEHTLSLGDVCYTVLLQHKHDKYKNYFHIKIQIQKKTTYRNKTFG